MDEYNSSNSNHVKEHMAMQSLRDSSNTTQFVEVFDKLGEEDCVSSAIVILMKAAKKSISRLSNLNYQMNVSPKNELAVKN